MLRSLIQLSFLALATPAAASDRTFDCTPTGSPAVAVTAMTLNFDAQTKTLQFADRQDVVLSLTNSTYDVVEARDDPEDLATVTVSKFGFDNLYLFVMGPDYIFDGNCLPS